MFTIRLLFKVPVTLRTSLPSSGAKGAMAIGPVRVTEPASGAIAILPLSARLLPAPALKRASKLA